MIPLFLSAQGNQIPELQRIIVSDGSRVAMATTLEGAVNGVFGDGRRQPPATPTPRPARPAMPGAAPTNVSRRALELLDQAERALQTGDYAGFGRYMRELRDYLRSQQ